MTTNPYSSPQVPGGPESKAPEGMREQLRNVAKSQKLVLYALLAQIIINAVAMFGGGGNADGGLSLVSVVLGILAVVVAVFSLGAMYQLSSSLGDHVGISVLCMFSMCIPCVSLIVLLVKNGQATSLLQKNGVKVSFMGADPNSI